LNIIDEIIKEHPVPICSMVDIPQIRIILKNLEKVIHLDGNVVELGCNVGTTTLYIQRYLDKADSTKDIYAYDSFQGLPEPCEFDGDIPCEITHAPKGAGLRASSQNAC
jgi:hypothetical protein